MSRTSLVESSSSPTPTSSLQVPQPQANASTSMAQGNATGNRSMSIMTTQVSLSRDKHQHDFRALFLKSSSVQSRKTASTIVQPGIGSTVGDQRFNHAWYVYYYLYGDGDDVAAGGVLEDQTNTTVARMYSIMLPSRNNSYDNYMIASSPALEAFIGTLPLLNDTAASGMLGHLPRGVFRFPNPAVENETATASYTRVSSNGDDLSYLLYDIMVEAELMPKSAFYPIASPSGRCKRPSYWANVDKSGMYVISHCIDGLDRADYCIDAEDVDGIKMSRYSVPAAGITFKTASIDDKHMAILLQLPQPEDSRRNGFPPYWVNSLFTKWTESMGIERAMVVMVDIINAFIMTMSDVLNIKLPEIIGGTVDLPHYTLDSEPFDIVSAAAGTLFPMALSFLLPVFVHTLVIEKETQLMKSMGMPMSSYWGVTWLFDVFVYYLVILPFILFCLYMEVNFFLKPDAGVWILLLLLWGPSQVSLAFLFSTFFNEARAAGTVTKVIIWTSIISSIVVARLLYDIEEGVMCDWWYLIYPYFAFFRGFDVISFSVTSNLHAPLTMQDVIDNKFQMGQILLTMALTSVLFTVLALYIDQVHPGTYGVPKHPLFFLEYFRCGKKKHHHHDLPALPRDTLVSVVEDDDVTAQRDAIDNCNVPDAMIIARGLTKDFKMEDGTYKRVLDNYTITIDRDTVFCMLGPNGCAKTTTVNLLTGLYPMTAGEAVIGGLDVKEDIDLIRKHLGVCPQGVTAAKEKLLVNEILEKIGLAGSGHLLSSELSGGMKRRLSVGMAIIGDPDVIFLDEPTTGLDPVSRRMVWDIVSKAKKGKCVILTTHSMEEADVLSDKIAMMSHGYIKGLGTPLHLKAKFGEGYKLTIMTKKDMVETVHAFVKTTWPSSSISTTFEGAIAYQIPRNDCHLSELFKIMQANKSPLKIDDWSIQQSTLEEVFRSIVADAEDY